MLLVSAADFEAAASLAALSAKGASVRAEAIGIGALNAAKSAERVQQLAKDEAVIFLGTCGTFGSFRKPQLVTGEAVVWLPTAERLGKAYTVSGSAPKIPLAKSSHYSQDLPQKTIVCSPAISTDASLDKPDPERYVENLELYSVAAELLAAAKSLDIILVTTNAIGPDAHGQWLTHFKEAAQMTAAYLEERYV